MNPTKEKTTILFVNKGPQNLKPLQISSNLILNWKKYLAALSLFCLCLIVAIVFLAINNIEQQKSSEILSRRINSINTKPAEADSNVLRKQFTNINRQLSAINDFLKARGIQTVYEESMCDKANNNAIPVTELGNFYEGYLDRISYDISYTPIGLPFHGNITSTFGQRENPFGGNERETHRGLDIKGPFGGQVKAMAKGEVEFAGVESGFGNCIILKHGNGFETLYGHLSKILVKVGQQIDIGEPIGLIGSTGRSTGPHLHYEVHRYGRKINPESFLNLN
jgi:murein DD-endopeptidase MepM/ murein hydrolase activator NlpD